MLAVGPRQIHPLGETGQTEEHARLAAIDPRLVLVERFLLGQVALDQHTPTPVALKAIEHVLHLFA